MFEFDVSTVVFKWWDIIFNILVNMLSVKSDTQTSLRDRDRQQEMYILHNYFDLQKFIKAKTDRLQLALTTKFFVILHYWYQKISQINERNICINNNLNYALFNSKKTSWMKELLDCCDVHEKCTLKFLAESYKELQYIIKNMIHIFNEMTASQAECLNTLTIHEFYVFETLRSDH